MKPAMSHATGAFVSDGVEIAYRLFDGPARTPMIIVHGLSFISYDWIGPASALAADRPVAAMDMRGFGESGWAKDYSIPTVAADIVALMDHLGWDRAVLAGHSMGGRMCVYAAAQNPPRAAALVLGDWSPVNAPAGNRRVAELVAGAPDLFASVDDAMAYFGVDPAAASPAQRARYEAYLKPEGGGLAIKRDTHYRDAFRRMLQTGEAPARGVDLWAALGQVQCPILAVRGARSDMFAAETKPRMQEANPRLRLVELDTGHDVAGGDPDGLVREVRGFLDRNQV
jgi:pimeloyl-ACP methyl ester carboxylesterase